jgi:hypothetical protein
MFWYLRPCLTDVAPVVRAISSFLELGSGHLTLFDLPWLTTKSRSASKLVNCHGHWLDRLLLWRDKILGCLQIYSYRFFLILLKSGMLVGIYFLVACWEHHEHRSLMTILMHPIFSNLFFSSVLVLRSSDYLNLFTIKHLHQNPSK